MKKKIIVSLLVATMCFTLSGCGNNTGNKPVNNTINNYGSVEEVTVFDSIDKFNVELSNHEMHYFANNDYMIAQDGLYWYGIYEDITCYVKPVTFTDDINKDTTGTIAIRYDVNSKNEAMALNYIKYLIKANNASLSDTEISELMTKAKDQSSAGKTANNGKGLTVGVLTTDEIIEYQITRLYNEKK